MSDNPNKTLALRLRSFNTRTQNIMGAVYNSLPSLRVTKRIAATLIHAGLALLGLLMKHAMYMAALVLLGGSVCLRAQAPASMRAVGAVTVIDAAAPQITIK